MVITKYLIKEILKTQVAILFILSFIFFSQKLVTILDDIINHDIPAHLIFSLLGLGFAKMAELILPLSLFFALLMTYGKLYNESEIIAMYACGVGKTRLIKVALVLAALTSLFATINVFYFSPWSVKHEKKIINEERVNPGLSALVKGQFQSSPDGKIVLFIQDIQNKKFHKIFLAQRESNHTQRPTVVVANSGYISAPAPGIQLLTLNHGMNYEGISPLGDFRITYFNHYQAVISRKSVTKNSNTAQQMSISSLWEANDPDTRAELHWRLTLIVSVVIMAFMAVPLSQVNPRQGRVLSMLPAMLLYLIFFLLQSTLRSNAGNNRLDPLIWLWLVNGLYTILAIILNIWDSSTLRRLYTKSRETL